MDRVYKYLRWLSIDIVLGAIFFLTYLQKYYQISLSFHVYVALGSAIWLIYTADHLMDSQRLQHPASDRHSFHHRHFNLLVIAGGVVLCGALVNLYFLEVEIIRNGAILSAICVAYLLLVYFFPQLWMKELLVAIVYALGIFLAPLSLKPVGWGELLHLGQLSIIALVNLLLFSLFETRQDELAGFNSLALKLGYSKALQVVEGLLVVSILISTLSYVIWSEQIQLIFVSMTLVFGFILFNRDYFRYHERFRVIGDGIFYLPILFYIL